MILQDIDHFNSLITSSKEAFRQGASGPAQEMRLVVNAWGFNLEDINIPIGIWHGKLDVQVPLSHAEMFRDKLPNAKLRFCEKDAHISILYNHVDEIFQSVKSA